MLANLDGEYAYLTTTGRATGTEHQIEIWFAGDGPTLWLISGGHDRSDWVRNLLADQRARVRVGDETFSVRARCGIADATERDTAVRLLHAKYATQVSATADQWLADAYLVASVWGGVRRAVRPSCGRRRGRRAVGFPLVRRGPGTARSCT